MNILESCKTTFAENDIKPPKTQGVNEVDKSTMGNGDLNRSQALSSIKAESSSDNNTGKVSKS